MRPKSTTIVCPRCRQAKPRTAFREKVLANGQPNGVGGSCADCRTETAAKRAKTVDQRFFERVDRAAPNGCWLWTGKTFTDGYGLFTVKGKPRRAHRVVWEMAHGPIPDGLQVCHHCDTPLCVNPAHLFLGTNADNMADRDAKGRACRTAGEARWSSRLTEAQVIEIRERYAVGGISQTALADEYGISFQNVSMIVRRKTWTHL